MRREMENAFYVQNNISVRLIIFRVNRTKEALSVQFRRQGILQIWQDSSNVHKYLIVLLYAQ